MSSLSTHTLNPVVPLQWLSSNFNLYPVPTVNDLWKDVTPSQSFVTDVEFDLRISEASELHTCNETSQMTSKQTSGEICQLILRIYELGEYTSYFVVHIFGVIMFYIFYTRTTAVSRKIERLEECILTRRQYTLL